MRILLLTLFMLISFGATAASPKVISVNEWLNLPESDGLQPCLVADYMSTNLGICRGGPRPSIIIGKPVGQFKIDAYPFCLQLSETEPNLCVGRWFGVTIATQKDISEGSIRGRVKAAWILPGPRSLSSLSENRLFFLHRIESEEMRTFMKADYLISSYSAGHTMYCTDEDPVPHVANKADIDLYVVNSVVTSSKKYCYSIPQEYK